MELPNRDVSAFGWNGWIWLVWNMISAGACQGLQPFVLCRAGWHVILWGQHGSLPCSVPVLAGLNHASCGGLALSKWSCTGAPSCSWAETTLGNLSISVQSSAAVSCVLQRRNKTRCSPAAGEPWERRCCCLCSCPHPCSLALLMLMGTARGRECSHTLGSALAAPWMSLCSHLCPSGGVTVLRHWNFIICFWEELAGTGICVGSKAIAEQYVWMDLVVTGEILGISCTCCDSGLVWFGGTVWFCLCRRAYGKAVMYCDSEMSEDIEWLGLCGGQGEGGAGAEIFLCAQAALNWLWVPHSVWARWVPGPQACNEPWLSLKHCPVPSLPPVLHQERSIVAERKPKHPGVSEGGQSHLGTAGDLPLPARAPWWGEPRSALPQHPQGCVSSRMDLLPANTRVPAHRDPVLHFPKFL